MACHLLAPNHYYTPCFNKVERWVYWFHLVHLSIPPSVRPSVCPSVDGIVSALYLQQYSLDPFHICTSYQATSEGVSRVMFVSKFKNLKFWRILWICNFDFVFFCLGIQYDSMVWVIMRQQRYPQNEGVLVLINAVEPSRTTFNNIWFKMQSFSIKEMHLKMLSVKWRPFCLDLNVLTMPSRMIFIANLSQILILAVNSVI